MCFIEIWYLWYIFYTKFVYILCKFHLVRSFDYSWSNNLIALLCKRNIRFILEKFVLLLSHFLMISTANIGKVVSILFSQRWSNANEQTQLLFSTKYKSWSNIDLSTLNQRNSFNVVSKLFYERWNNFDKHTLAQLPFSTKFQRWNNVVLSTFNRRNSIDVVSTLFCQRWNNVSKCTLAQLSFSTKYQRRNNIDERWRAKLFKRSINIDVFAGDIDISILAVAMLKVMCILKKHMIFA